MRPQVGDYPRQHDQQLRDIAELLISRYGERALTHASYQALKARRDGLPRHVEAWRQIADTVVEALHAEVAPPQ